MRFALLVAVAASTAAFAPRSSHAVGRSRHTAVAPSPVVGTWAIEWEIGRTVTNGAPGSIMARGTMVVTAAGDSLHAAMTMQSRSDGGTIRPPYTMRGIPTDSGATFTHESQATMSVNGGEQRQMVTSIWTLRVQGDSLTGSIARDLPGMLQGTMRSSVRGTRSRT